MPCIKCANGKWKYGQRGRCQFDTLAACKAAEAAIHARDRKDMAQPCGNCTDCGCTKQKLDSSSGQDTALSRR